MSKKRLEEIAYNVGISFDGEKALMSSDDYDFLYNYALEQAERVEGLLKQTGYNFKVLRKLDAQNKRYREALKFYADERNYEDIGIPTGNNPPALPILEDRGQVARKELEGEKHGKH